MTATTRSRCPTAADAATRAGYLAASKPPPGDGYDHQNAALLLLSADVTPAHARVLIAEFDNAAMRCADSKLRKRVLTQRGARCARAPGVGTTTPRRCT